MTEANKKQIERERQAGEVKDAQERTEADAYAQRLEALEIEIARRVGENNIMYGSVTSADIAHALGAKGFEVDKRKVQLPDPIKALGDVQVPVKVHRDVVAQVKRQGRRRTAVDRRTIERVIARERVYPLRSRSPVFFFPSHASRSPWPTSPPLPNVRCRTASTPRSRCSARS